MRLLLEVEADVNLKGEGGRSALSHASEKYCNPKLVQLLLEHGADPKDITKSST